MMFSIATDSIKDATYEVAILKAFTVLIFRTLPYEQRASIIDVLEQSTIYVSPGQEEQLRNRGLL